MISSARGERRVAVIEVVSPGNRDSRRRARFFQAKLLECLSGGLHVLLIDLLPPSAAAPGFASELAQELGAGEGSLQPGGRAVTSFERREEPTSVLVYHHALALGEALPEPPLFLAPEHFVSVPLEATYAETVGGLPAVDRELLGAG